MFTDPLLDLEQIFCRGERFQLTYCIHHEEAPFDDMGLTKLILFVVCHIFASSCSYLIAIAMNTVPTASSLEQRAKRECVPVHHCCETSYRKPMEAGKEDQCSKSAVS